ncbi:MAG TPA: protease pro-enzyme activation domain-containing protein, partial [Acidimicrobiales bacterium]
MGHRRVIPVLAIGLLLTAAPLTPGVGAAPAQGVLSGHSGIGAGDTTLARRGAVRLERDVLPGLSRLVPSGTPPPGQVLHIGVGLALPDPAAAQAYYRGEYDPASPEYGEFLTPAEFAARFGVAPQTYSAVQSWLRAGGLMIDQTTSAGDWVAA